jgi:hypothetical protein
LEEVELAAAPTALALKAPSRMVARHRRILLLWDSFLECSFASAEHDCGDVFEKGRNLFHAESIFSRVPRSGRQGLSIWCCSCAVPPSFCLLFDGVGGLRVVAPGVRKPVLEGLVGVVVPLPYVRRGRVATLSIPEPVEHHLAGTGAIVPRPFIKDTITRTVDRRVKHRLLMHRALALNTASIGEQQPSRFSIGNTLIGMLGR